MRGTRIHGMDLSPQARYDTRASNASTKSTDSDGDLPPLLQEYFDKSGDLMVLRGHLEDLDLQEAEKLSQRELLRDQDFALPKTEQQFTKEYSDMHGHFLDRFKVLQAETENLRASIDSNGVDVDQAKWRTSRPSKLASSFAATSVPLSAPTTFDPSAQKEESLGEQSLGRPSSLTSRQKGLDLITRFQRLRPGSNFAQSLPTTPAQMEDTDPTSSQPSERQYTAATNTTTLLDGSANRSSSHHRRSSSLRPHSSQHDTTGASISTPTLLPSSNATHAHDGSASSTSISSFPAFIKRGASLPENSLSTPLHPSEDQYKRVQGVDKGTGTQFHLEYGPPDDITDPELRKFYGVYARKRVAGTSGDVETLDSSFYIPSQSQKFFRQGKVFAILWAEPNVEGDDPVTEITYNEVSTGVYAKVRRFVVIRAMQGYCSAIPITTNHGKGVSGEKKSDFAVVHTSRVPPDILPEEQASIRGDSGMRNMSIRIEPDDKSFSLDPISRLNFGKVYTIDYSVKVKSIGMVHRTSMRHLLYQFRDVWKSAFTPAALANSPSPNPVAALRTEELLARTRTEPLRGHRPPKEEVELDGSAGQPLPHKYEDKTSSSLIQGASGAVEALLSRGHSVDQILSAIGSKTYLRGQSRDLGLEDSY